MKKFNVSKKDALTIGACAAAGLAIGVGVSMLTGKDTDTVVTEGDANPLDDAAAGIEDEEGSNPGDFVPTSHAVDADADIKV